jgi:hypothetical protein
VDVLEPRLHGFIKSQKALQIERALGIDSQSMDLNAPCCGIVSHRHRERLAQCVEQVAGWTNLCPGSEQGRRFVTSKLVWYRPGEIDPALLVASERGCRDGAALPLGRTPELE